MDTICLGLLRRKECWVPTRRALVFGSLVGALLIGAAFLGAYSFLALNRPVEADILAVEGWVGDYALKFSAREFRQGNYRLLCSTGGPLAQGSFLVGYKTFGEVGAATLCAMGVASNVVVAVPAPETQVDRTYQSALALRRWFDESEERVKGINVVTVGSHARRSRLLFERAFGNAVKIGVIAVPPADYDSGRWWRFSQGWRDVIGESVGYVYALCVF